MSRRKADENFAFLRFDFKLYLKNTISTVE